jgi:hypothetical protein
MLFCIVAVIFFAIFGEFIKGLITIIVGLIFFALFAYIVNQLFSNFFIETILTLISISAISFCVYFSDFFINIFLNFFNRFKNSNAVHKKNANEDVMRKNTVIYQPKWKEEKLKSSDKKDLSDKGASRITDLLDSSLNEFKAKYPFVVVEVDSSLRTTFIKECEWLEKKLGYFPTEVDQLAILKSLKI